MVRTSGMAVGYGTNGNFYLKFTMVKISNNNKEKKSVKKKALDLLITKAVFSS